MRHQRQNFLGAPEPALDRATMALTAIFWLGSYLLNSARAALLGQGHDLHSYILRLMLNLIGAGVCWVSQRMILRHRGTRFQYRIMLVTAFAIFGAVIYALINTTISVAVLDDTPAGHNLTAFILSLNYWSWFFLAWAGMLLGLVYSYEAIDRERQLSDALVSSHLAKIKALRYQVNPHFLFNTLNAIASLVPCESTAERLILDLSSFFRMTLAIDPVADIRLEREFEIQMLYLNIEKARYGERLDLTVDLADAARGVLVPSLILQPLIENAIKHGLSSTRTTIRIELAAHVIDGEGLEIHVRDNGTASTHVPPGTGVGLENVSQRLRSRFGDAARLNVGPCEDGGFEAVIVINRPEHDPRL